MSLTQNNTTATIEQFLKSRYRNPLTNQLDGLALDENGDFLHYNKIIDSTFNELFKDMHLNKFVDDDFKKEFCKKFYNREIGLETFARFQILLESSLNTECYNLLQARSELKEKTLEQLNTSIDVTNKGSGNNQGLGIANTTPQDKLEIIYTKGEGIIDHANALQENHGKYDNLNHTTGWNGEALGIRLTQLGYLDELTFSIFNILDSLFLQVF